MGQIAVENDGSAQGVQATSLKEGLGRGANRPGAGAQASSSTSAMATNNSGFTQLAQTALAGTGNRQTLVWLSLLALGGTAGTDFTVFQISWPMDNGTRPHIIYLTVAGAANLHLGGGAINTAQNGQITVSACGTPPRGRPPSPACRP
jgi:hypothetical protein